MYGPGVEGPVIAKEPTHFTIDAKQAGPGAVEVALSDHQGQTVDIDVLDHQDGSFTVKYVAPRPGAYQVCRSLFFVNWLHMLSLTWYLLEKRFLRSKSMFNHVSTHLASSFLD